MTALDLFLFLFAFIFVLFILFTVKNSIIAMIFHKELMALIQMKTRKDFIVFKGENTYDYVFELDNLEIFIYKKDSINSGRLIAYKHEKGERDFLLLSIFKKSLLINFFLINPSRKMLYKMIEDNKNYIPATSGS